MDVLVQGILEGENILAGHDLNKVKHLITLNSGSNSIQIDYFLSKNEINI